MISDKDNRIRHELEAEAAELSDVLRRLDAVRGMVSEAWAGETSKAFLNKLEELIHETEGVKRMIDRTAEEIR